MGVMVVENSGDDFGCWCCGKEKMMVDVRVSDDGIDSGRQLVVKVVVDDG